MSNTSYCPNTPEEIREMLGTIGVASVEELFGAIPADLRTRSFYLPPGMSEFEMTRHIQSLAEKHPRDIANFIGGGYYDHLIPAAVDHLAGRAEFYTAYTPYQPECSQGTLQALFEYQTAICRLTGMEVANASLYDGATALAEAAMMAMRVTGRERVVIDCCVNPFYRQVVRTYLANLGVEIVEIPPSEGIIDRPGFTAAVDERTAAVIVQNPNFFGSLDDLGDLAELAHSKVALLVTSVYPISLGLVTSPGEMGVDIVTGDGQSLGNPLSFGGPSFGFIATTRKYIRNLPGRIIGETVDREGRRGFVLTLQAREQHIKRHKATSNICQQPEPLRPARVVLPGKPGPRGVRGVGPAQLRQGGVRQVGFREAPRGHYPQSRRHLQRVHPGAPQGSGAGGGAAPGEKDRLRRAAGGMVSGDE